MHSTAPILHHELQRDCIGDDLDEPNRTFGRARNPIRAIDIHPFAYPTTLNHLAICLNIPSNCRYCQASLLGLTSYTVLLSLPRMLPFEADAGTNGPKGADGFFPSR